MNYSFAQHTLVNTNVNFNVPAGVYVVVPGDVINNSSSTINNNGNIFLSGDFTNNASVISSSNSNVKLFGAAQNIGGSNSTTFGNLIIDGTADKAISIDTKILNTLLFNANHVIIGNNNMVLLQNAVTSGAFNNKYVVTNGFGSLVKKSLPTSTSFLFPVGDAVASYKPVTLDYTGVTDTFAVRVEAGVNPTTGADAECVQYTYVVEESINGGTNATMSLGWNAPDEGALFTDPQSMMWQNVSGVWGQLAGTPGSASNLPATDWLYQTSGISDFSSNANRFILRSTQQLTILIPPVDSSICSGTDALFTVTASGVAPLTYQWQSNCGAGWVNLTNTGVFSGVNTDSLVITGAGANMDSCLFQCIVSNATSADTSSAAILIVNASLPVSVSISATPSISICAGTNVTFNAAAMNGGASPVYQWQLNGVNVGTNSSTYSNSTLNDGDQISCILTSSANCAPGPDTSSVTMIVNLPPVASIAPGPVSFCQGDSAMLISGSGNNVIYQWQLNGVNISGATDSVYYASQAGNYAVIVSNSCGSDTSITIVASQMPLPSAVISPGSVNICQGGSAVLSSNTGTGYSYQWQVNGTNISGAIDSVYTVMVPGTYSLIVTNNCGSVLSQPVTVSVDLPPAATALPTGPTNFCAGENVVLIANNDTSITYQWQLNGIDINGATTSTYTANQPGDYSVIVTNACGSDTSAIIPVNIFQSPAVDAGNAVTIIAGNSTTLIATGIGGTPPYSYSWNPPGSLNDPTIFNPTASPTDTTTYTVIITDANGCTSMDTVTVFVEYDMDIYIPSGFSPNGDGENDVLYVRGHGIKYMDLIIYDRWGEKIFESTNQADGWDGTFKGKALDPAVFVYYLNAIFYNNEQVFKKGNITLVR